MYTRNGQLSIGGTLVKMMACLTSDLPPGSMISVDILGHTVLVANVDGQFFAMDGICSHSLAMLVKGRLDGTVVVCPRHQARYDIRTGRAIGQPIGVEGRAHDLRSYPVEVRGGCVTVDI